MIYRKLKYIQIEIFHQNKDEAVKAMIYGFFMVLLFSFSFR